MYGNHDVKGFYDGVSPAADAKAQRIHRFIRNRGSHYGAPLRNLDAHMRGGCTVCDLDDRACELITRTNFHGRP
jgi:hypothetical protein